MQPCQVLLTYVEVFPQVMPSAHKHGITVEDMQHAWRLAIRKVHFEYDGQERILLIGPDRGAQLLELVVINDEPARIIHADRLRPSRYDYLR